MRQILVALAELEQACGDREAAKQLYKQAPGVIEYIAAHANELRNIFLAKRAVAAVPAERQA